MKDATRRISTLLVAIVMLLTMTPLSVLGDHESTPFRFHYNAEKVIR